MKGETSKKEILADNEINFINIRDIFNASKRHWKLGATIGLLGMAVTIAVTVLSPVLYRSTASVLIENSSKGMMSTHEQSLSTTQDVTKAQKILAESRPVIMKTCDLSGIPLPEIKHGNPHTALPDYFEARIDGQLLYLDVMDTNAKRATVLANAWAQAFIEEMTQRAKAPSIYTKDFLNKSLPDLRNDWITKQEALNQFEQDTRFDPKEFEQHPLRKRVEELSNKMNTLNLQLAAFEAEQEVVNKPGVSSDSLLQLPRAKNDLVLQGFQRQVEDRRAKLMDSLEKFKPDTLAVQAARESVAQAQKDVTKAADVLGMQIQIDLQKTLSERTKVQTQLEVADKQFEELKSKAAKHRVLSSEATMAEHLYSELSQKKSESDLTGRFELSYATHWEQAEEHSAPYLPKWRRNLALGFLLSAMLAVFAIFIAEKLDDTIRNSRDLEKRFNVSIAGMIPTFDKVLVKNDGYLLVKRQAHSPAVDALRNFHIGIQLEYRTKKPLVITVTSPAPGDGKSFITANLAALFVTWGHNVLVVDADLRKGSLSSVFNHADKPGLYDLLEGASWTPQYALNGLSPGFRLLPAGKSSTENFSGIKPEKFDAVLQKLKKEFDVIIIDTPPILAIADASVVSQFSDVAILVARSRKSHLGQIERAAAALYSSDVKDLLFVVNGVDISDAANDDYGYGYGYGYGYEDGRGGEGARKPRPRPEIVSDSKLREPKENGSAARYAVSKEVERPA